MEKNLENFDDVQFIANETLRQYRRAESIGEGACFDYMARLGAIFIPEENPPPKPSTKPTRQDSDDYFEVYYGE